jgi:hypothetical protein
MIQKNSATQVSSMSKVLKIPNQTILKTILIGIRIN